MVLRLRPIATKALERAGITVDGREPFDPQIKDERVFRDSLLWGSLGLGDAYVNGWWECEKIDEFFYRMLRAGLEHDHERLGDWLLQTRDRIMNMQSVRRALQVAEHHYDIGNDLYRDMLGKSMAYSSAYFKNTYDLTEAQYAKFELTCKTLGLRPGMKVLEIGSGWGTFAAFAAKNYGVEVLGVTVSKEQLEYARAVCKDFPIDFHFGDYRTLPKEKEGTFDRAVSIEMIEAVGSRNLRTYMEVASRMLKTDGQFLVQAILGSGKPDAWLSTRIFPNGVLPSLTQLAKATHGVFRLAHTESFGAYYDQTLMEWDRRFRDAWPKLKGQHAPDGNRRYDDRFNRMWRYYLMVCAGAFRSGKIDVAQLLFSKPGLS